MGKVFLFLFLMSSVWIHSLVAVAQVEPGRLPQDESTSHRHGSHDECPLPKTATDILRCVQDRHPNVQRARLTLAQTDGFGAWAAQFPNPELEAETVRGSIGGEKRSESKLALLQPIELGGKRTARKLEAESQKKQAQAELAEVQSDVTVATVAKLHRLRQLEREKAVLTETVETFEQVVRQQRSRPGLAPEQKVSLSVFRMALSETKIRQSELFEEEKAIENFFHITTGHSLAEIKSVLPSAPAVWPALKTSADINSSPQALLSQAELHFAHAKMKTAQAESWPEFKLGPSVQFEEEGRTRGSIWGLQLTMELPIFNWNGGGREHAAAGVQRAEKGVQLVQSEENHARAELARVYERTVAALKEVPTAEALEKEHKEQEGLTKRGLISAALVIESHRQLDELVRSRHQRELQALDSLWRIYKLEGRILAESL